MALDGHVQPALFASRHAGNVALSHAELRQYLLCQRQQALSGAGKLHGARLADEQWRAQALLEVLQLMGEGRLGEVDTLRGFDQRACITQGQQGTQMAQFKHDEWCSC